MKSTSKNIITCVSIKLIFLKLHNKKSSLYFHTIENQKNPSGTQILSGLAKRDGSRNMKERNITQHYIKKFIFTQQQTKRRPSDSLIVPVSEKNKSWPRETRQER